eukprot:2020347-Pyramimonas_sp.AAC.1
MPEVMLDLRGGDLDSVGLHLVLAAALEGHDVAWVAEHPVKEGKGLFPAFRSPPARLDGSDVAPAEVLEGVRAEPAAARLDLAQHVHVADP